MTNPTSEAILATEHANWLNHAVTKQLLHLLKKHEDSIAESIANSAMDKDKLDDHVRRLATQLATTKTIKKLINETQTFVAKSSGR